ncbi:MAG TPA: hypothetical protein VGA78_05585 [Gemmatimonadales bacterium]
MPTPVAHVGAVALCPHGGPVTEIPATPRVLLSGMPAATMADQYLIAGCVFNVAGAPHPCVRVQWLVPAVRVTASLMPLILQTSVGLCLAADQVPQGPPVVSSTQPRVLGT